MDNHEDYLDALTAYARNPGPDIPPVLEQYLNGVAKNGETLFQWVLLKPLIVGKMEQVIQELSHGLNSENIPTRPNVENVRFEVMHARIMDALHKINGAPFTIQRLCELLLDPKRHYKRSDKFMRGLEKNVLVVSTVDPFGRKVVSDSSHKSLVNGMDSNRSPFLPRDPHTSTPLPPVPGWVTSSIASRSHSSSEGATNGHSPPQQDSGNSTNGVAGGLGSSVYATDQGEQPLAVHAEEVVEETVVTMDTNEVAAVTADGGEAMAEEEEDEEMGGEDTNASSSSSSSEELSISDSSDSSVPTLATNGSSSESSPPQERPWACMASKEEIPPDKTVASSPTDCSTRTDHDSPDIADKSSLSSTPASKTSASTSSGSGQPQSSENDTGQPQMSSTSIAWHPLSTDQSISTSEMVVPSQQNSSCIKKSEGVDPNNSFGFEVAITSDTEFSGPGSQSKVNVELEDSSSVDDNEEPGNVVAEVSAHKDIEETSDKSVPNCSQDVVASSSNNSPSLFSHTEASSASSYIECDSVAGLERLVCSVDAASPITVLSSSSSLSLSSQPLPSSLSPHSPPVSTASSTNQTPTKSAPSTIELSHSQSPQQSAPENSSELEDEGPDAKRCRLSNTIDESAGEDTRVPDSIDISSSTVQEIDTEQLSSPSAAQADNFPADTTFELSVNGGSIGNVGGGDENLGEKETLFDGEALVSESSLVACGDEGTQKYEISSPPSQLSSSSDSQGFDMCGDGMTKRNKEEQVMAEDESAEGTVSSATAGETEDAAAEDQTEPMEHE